MGNGRLNQDIGYGSATVWNPQFAVQNFGNLIQQQKLKQQADNDMLATEISKVRSDGLRNDADREAFFKQYNDIKNQAIGVQSERDPMKRSMAKAQIKDQLLRLQDYAQRSKQQGANEQAWAKSYMANPVQWGDDALKQYQASSQSALTAPTVVKDFTTLQRKPNIDKINKDIAGIVAGNLKSQIWQTDRKSGKEGNMTGTFEMDKRAINPEQVYLGAANYYDLHPDFQRQLQQSFPDLYANNDPQQAKALALKQYVDTGLQSGVFGAINESGKERFRADRAPDRFYEHALWRIEHPSGNGTMQSPAQTLIAGDPSNGISGMQQGGVGTGEKFINLAPKAQYGGKTPTIGVDQETGEHLFQFPAQIGPKDRAAIKFNDDLRKKYEKNPEKIGGFFGMGGEKIPFEKSKLAIQLKPEVTIKRPAQTYRLNPASPDYLAQAAELAKEQNINLSQLNQIEGKKGNRGQIQQAQGGKAPVQKKEAERPTGATLIKVSLNGQEGEVPLDKYMDFKKKYPQAKRIN